MHILFDIWALHNIKNEIYVDISGKKKKFCEAMELCNQDLICQTNPLLRQQKRVNLHNGYFSYSYRLENKIYYTGDKIWNLHAKLF